MSDDELLDIYDEDGTHLGVRRRDLVHRDGDWHAALHCWVVAAHADGPVVLLQRRGRRTSWFPGHLDITAAGHLAAGESPADALREIAEEIGVVVTLDDLRHVGELRLDISTATMRNRERDHVYVLRDDRPAGGYTFPDGSVTALVEVGLAEFAAIVTTGATHAATEHAPGRAGRPCTVRPEDLVPLGVAYFTAVLPHLRAAVAL